MRSSASKKAGTSSSRLSRNRRPTSCSSSAPPIRRASGPRSYHVCSASHSAAPRGADRGKLRRIAEAEGRTVTDDAIELIAQRAAGGMRDAESMLDQVISSGVESIDADTVRDLLGLADLRASIVRHGPGRRGPARRHPSARPARGTTAATSSPSPTRSSRACANNWCESLSPREIGRLIDLPDSPAPPDASPGWTSTAGRPVATDSSSSSRSGTDHDAGTDYQRQPTRISRATASPPANRRQRSQRHMPRRRPRRRIPSSQAEPPASRPAVARSLQSTASPAEAAPMIPRPHRALPDATSPAVLGGVAGDRRADQCNPANKPLIEACRPVEVSGATIVLGFPENKSFLRENAERKSRRSKRRSAGARPCRGGSLRRHRTSSWLRPGGAGTVDLVEQARRVFEDDLARRR